MATKITAYEVKSLHTINVTNYKNGDLFITNRSIGILANGKIQTLETSKTDLSQYVKKADVQKMIEKAVKNNG